MNNETILKKAIEKAVKNGYHKECLHPDFGKHCEAFTCESEGGCVYTIIFSHDFAKAFWGNKKWKGDSWEADYEWEFRLKEMVLEKEPLLYLKQFLDD